MPAPTQDPDFKRVHWVRFSYNVLIVVHIKCAVIVINLYFHESVNLTTTVITTIDGGLLLLAVPK